MQGGWQPPPGGGGYGPPGYGTPPPGPQTGGHFIGGPQGPQSPQPYAPAQPSYGQYEFNEYENAIIDKTAARAKLWGWISAVLGATQILGGSCGAIFSAALVTYLPLGIVLLVVGITFIGVGNSLKTVVSTRGNDLMHLMTALQKLGNAFLIQSIAFIITILLLAIGVVLMFFVFAVAAASH